MQPRPDAGFQAQSQSQSSGQMPLQPWGAENHAPAARPGIVEKISSLRWISWIWTVRGSLPLAPGQTGDEAFARLDPLFRERGTSYERTGDTLTFRKKDNASQDKMSVFDGGVLKVEQGVAGPVLTYALVSRILLFCFLAPLLFVAAAQLTIFIGAHQKKPVETAASKAAEEAKKKAAEVPMNPVDKFLGAPAPEKKKDGKDKEGGRRSKKPSPTPAYVFAVMFAVLFVVGRVLEDRLIRRVFRRKLGS
jgi:hypothetical protein